jgi:hypothetical protein
MLAHHLARRQKENSFSGASRLCFCVFGTLYDARSSKYDLFEVRMSVGLSVENVVTSSVSTEY